MHKNRKALVIVKSLLILLSVAGLTPAGATNMFNSPSGFLVPTTESLPAGYALFLHSSKNGQYGCQLDRYVKQQPGINKKVDFGHGIIATTGVIGEGGLSRDSQLFIAEWPSSPEDTYEHRIQYYDNDKHSEKLKDFTFEGSPGAIYKESSPIMPLRETYELFWKDGGRILRITYVFEQKDPTFSFESQVGMLAKFHRLK